MTQEQTKKENYFRESMRRAFLHGRDFKTIGDGSDISSDNSDCYLPFSEWFNKYFKNEAKTNNDR